MENTIIQNFVYFEGMTSISALITAIESNRNDRRIVEVLFEENKKSSKERELRFLQQKAKKHGFKVTFVNSDDLSDYSLGSTHGGIIARCTNRTFNDLEKSDINPNGVYYMFEGIEDPYNFGYVIRSVYAAGADGVIMGARNWFNSAATVAKSSAGTSELIDIYICEPAKATTYLKSKGFQIVCAGIRDSETIYDAELKRPMLVIIGGEKRGISRSILDQADKIVRIDYGRNFRGSLPSVAATSIISFEILRKIQ
jgi:23S rRNA (guanosine2251-2'-O)-methyltransferase